ncbi:MAG: hypothetical protein PF630_03455, partial [Gammaproteobacteria bacterium]|nr:hypothetical protein [Gammaproteobacteria bacterium]
IKVSGLFFCNLGNCLPVRCTQTGAMRNKDPQITGIGQNDAVIPALAGIQSIQSAWRNHAPQQLLQ